MITLTSGFGLPLPSHGNSIVVPAYASISNGSLINFGLSGCSAFPQINLPAPKAEANELNHRRIWITREHIR